MTPTPKLGKIFRRIAYGSNNVGLHATLVKAQSLHYNLPAEFAQNVPGEKPFPRNHQPAASLGPCPETTCRHRTPRSGPPRLAR